METLQLIAHGAYPPVRVRNVMARILSFDANWCVLRWSVEGAGGVVVPPFAGAARQDDLWKTTCFELFVKAGEGYGEFNFSPSERWAAYDFTGYREGRTDRPAARAPVITPRRGGDVLIFDVAIPSEILPPLPWRYGLTAVLEESDGTRSFWAAAHGRDVPDFHDPACLAAGLAAPQQA